MIYCRRQYIDNVDIRICVQDQIPIEKVENFTTIENEAGMQLKSI